MVSLSLDRPGASGKLILAEDRKASDHCGENRFGPPERDFGRDLRFSPKGFKRIGESVEIRGNIRES